MNEGWEIIRLGDYAEKIGSGATPRGGSSVYVDKGEISLIRSQNIYNNGFSHGGLVYITKEAGENLRNVVVEEQDVLLNITGDSVARVCMPAPSILPARVNQHVAIIRTLKNEIDPLYLKYFLSSPRQQQVLLNLASAGATRNALTKGMIEDIILPKPPLKKQIRIREHLSVLDKKIHLLRQQNATLASMAQALFKSWFVDFDPVIDNALAAGRVLPEALGVRVALRGAVLAGGAYSGLPEEVKGLFPGSFVFSEELGKWVPEGWEVGPISSFAEVVGGGTPSTKVEEYFSADEIPWLSPKDLSGYEWKYISGGAKDITQAGLKNSSAKLLPIGTILFSSRAPIGYIAVALNELCTNQGFKSLIPNNCDATDYLYLYLKRYTPDLEAIATGSTFKEVSGGALKRFDILMPSPEVLGALSDIVMAWNEKLAVLQEEVSTLTRLRDILLPELISGRLGV